MFDEKRNDENEFVSDNNDNSENNNEVIENNQASENTTDATDICENAQETSSWQSDKATTDEASSDKASYDEVEIYEEHLTTAEEENVVYAGNADENVSGSSYEWNGQSQATLEVPANTPGTSSGKGFRVFIGIMLSVFTVSVLTLAILFASQSISDKKEAEATVNNSNSAPSNPSSAVVDKSSYVAYDFKEHTNNEALSIPEIAAKCSPSSVGIVSEVEVNYSSFFFGTSTGIGEASGSGFVYSADGYVITNHHVIEDAKKVTVIFPDGAEYEAEIVGSDSISDIAVLKITPDEGVELIPMEIGNSDELVVGEPVVAIGCPAGIEFIGTVTDGIVSSINRDIKIKDDYGSLEKTMTLIQTNATINHGNSGGPLINSRGQVIGINTLKLSQNYEGIGFSIPMNGALPIINQLIEHGQVVERSTEDFAYGKGIIGINGSAISEEESEYYGIPVGVLVVQINKDGSAARAGLRRGDIITHVNGKQTKTINEINTEKGNARPGTEITLTVYRDGEDNSGETLDITFKLDSQE